MRRGLALAVLLAGSLGSRVWAQPSDVPGMLKFAETQPAEMDHGVWKEKRREIVKKLATSKDKRAVPVLMRLADTETFDIVGEIAIEGLGNLGDPQAVPVLQKIAADVAREKNQRDLAAKALKKLGAPVAGPVAPPAPPTPPPIDNTPPPPPVDNTAKPVAPPPVAPPPDAGSMLLGSKPASDLPALPEVADDALAAYERITFLGGSGNLSYDNVRKRTDFAADLAGSYAKRIEREQLAWGVTADAHLVAGEINPNNAGLSRGAELDVNATGEARFYTGHIYGIGKAAAAIQENYVADTANDGTTTKFTAFAADLQIALGGGYGRLLDVGAAIRVRRLSRALDANKALGRQIDKSTAKRLELTWWALRGERTTYRALVATVAVLREAGVLLGEPDAGLAYEILNVLRDSQLYLRPSGYDFQVVFGEGYLQRPNDPPPTESGRVEQVIATAGYAQQLDEDKLEISGSAYARYRLFTPDLAPSPWAVGATASVRKFAYAEHGDPIGTLDVTGAIDISDDELPMIDKGLRITGSVGFTWWVNQAGGLRVAANVTEDTGALTFGLSLQGTYALLDGTFSGL